MGRRRISRQTWTYIILFWIVVIGFWWLERNVFQDTYESESAPVQAIGFPEAYIPSFEGGELIIHDYFRLSYAEQYEQAAWVAYTLDKAHLSGTTRKRPYYIQDPMVSTGSADWRNFKGSGYDRGHLCPAGDRKFSETAYNQTFYTSNISPQDRQFNAGIWNELEQQVRRWTRRYGRIYVITGGVLREGLNTIGTEGVAVPEAYYKVVIRGEGADILVIAFLIPNAGTALQPEAFLISLDDLEALTGLDFFSQLSEKAQQSVESTVDSGPWSF
jgi:endonuclease G